MKRQIIQTADAPKAIGPYSQAVRVGDTVYVSGQIPLDPVSGQLISGEIEAEIRRVFDNLKAIAWPRAASLAIGRQADVFLTDLSHFAKVNEIMATYFSEPYPARAAIGVASLPRGARVEDGVHSQPRLNRPAARPQADRRSASAGGAGVTPGARRGAAGGTALRASLARLGVEQPADVLFVLPLRYEDRTRVVPIGALQRGHARRGRRRNPAGRNRLPAPPPAAGAARGRLGLTDAALLLFLQCPARGPGTRRAAALSRRNAARAARTGNRASGIPPHRPTWRTAAADADADLSGDRRAHAGAPAHAGRSGAALARFRQRRPSCCPRRCSSGCGCPRCARHCEFVHRPPVGTAARRTHLGAFTRRSAGWHSRNCLRTTSRSWNCAAARDASPQCRCRTRPDWSRACSGGCPST